MGSRSLQALKDWEGSRKHVPVALHVRPVFYMTEPEKQNKVKHAEVVKTPEIQWRSGQVGAEPSAVWDVNQHRLLAWAPLIM